jgi:hypothetical protein
VARGRLYSAPAAFEVCLRGRLRRHAEILLRATCNLAEILLRATCNLAEQCRSILRLFAPLLKSFSPARRRDSARSVTKGLRIPNAFSELWQDYAQTGTYIAGAS